MPIISDEWPGLSAFFKRREEILIPSKTEDVVEILREMPDSERRAVGDRDAIECLPRIGPLG